MQNMHISLMVTYMMVSKDENTMQNIYYGQIMDVDIKLDTYSFINNFPVNKNNDL